VQGRSGALGALICARAQGCFLRTFEVGHKYERARPALALGFILPARTHRTLYALVDSRCRSG
jgi:hypothetical protein